MAVIITGTGRYIPEIIKRNEDFYKSEFYNADGKPVTGDMLEVVAKFKAITGIEERRYAHEDQKASVIATLAAKAAIADASLDPETLDGIIVAHNFGDIAFGQLQPDILPSLATRVKYNLGIQHPGCMAFDILFGCPGWMQGVIIAKQFIDSGNAQRFLVIGAETLSRVLDPHDRDSMIYADGAAATILEYSEEEGRGILSTASQTHAAKEAYYLHYGQSLKHDYTPGVNYIKMQGRKIYEFALNNVPAAMKHCLDRSGVGIADLKKVFIHQANEKMDEAIIQRFYQLYGIPELPERIMPMSIHELGNSSVATVPTLLDLVLKGEKEGHELSPGDVVLLASVGAGMNITALTYRI